ncbi:type I secretion system permease/ATPase [Comamonas endophytica]|uniref:Peptidase domain-containing ABC transporter n=1 Tax=Comamonas endophytica TaxID=2949090 RepID=A0ABY6GBS7_9BURK|nr:MULTISPECIES: type I secretion system permease/ATPase [unclassified Acidovorax]MCD2513458.1 peptidase domain-containing ABC transporter [Acidovorax sp. D4N7]UYG52526.1 peptidase domain-containing ABC transporter [Acidovorax sp. 5MLIR]
MKDEIRIAPAQGGRREELMRWVDPLLCAARALGLDVSPEQLGSVAAWASPQDLDAAIVEMASAAGLGAQFVDMPVARLSPSMLPALVVCDGTQVGVVTAVSAGQASVQLFPGGKAVERVLPLDGPGLAGAARVLLVQERAARRDDRVDAYLAAPADSWLYGLLKGQRRLLFDLGAGSLFGNLLAIGTSLFAMQVWDRVVPARSTHTLWVLAAGVALALCLELMLRTLRASLADRFGKRADQQLSAMFFARALDIRNDARPRSPGTLVAQLRDLEQLREVLTSTSLGVLLDMPFVGAFLFIIWLLGGPLVLVPLAAIPLLLLPGLLAQWPLARLSRQGQAESALRNAVLMESIYRAEDIKALQAEPRFRRLWERTNRVNAEIGLQQRHIAGLLVHGAQTVQQLAYVGVLVAGVYGILDASLSFGAVLACSILTSRTIAPLGQIPALLSRIQSARVGKKGLDGLLALPVDHDPAKEAYHKPALRGQYRFENVAYRFDPQDRVVLQLPQLSIQPGERVAVLGAVGAGKSTLLRLLGGLATPSQGRIILDDTPMPLIDVADVRRDVGLLLQESGLFYGTLRENLLIADPLASDEAILAAMRLACADQLLLKQPHGLDLKLREGGIGLSGGQKQVLMLARIFLRAPQVLLLDEATASLDEGTELAIIGHLRQWLGRRTLVLATHRYPLLSLVDRIIVLDNGRIVRDGPREQVLQALRGKPPNAKARAPATEEVQP